MREKPLSRTQKTLLRIFGYPARWGDILSIFPQAQATKENYAKQTRNAIENALRIEPEMSAAHISMGRWHTGIIDRIGRLMGRAHCLVRERKDALKHFDQASALNQQSKGEQFESRDWSDRTGSR